ncbi:MAG: hypothetical protein GYA48_15875 [Chloroflexi bacterium]|nr:hypothetical protein [Chloroflexota bacterium]
MKMKKFLSLLLLMVVLLSSCGPQPAPAGATLTPDDPAGELPQPAVNTTAAPDPQTAARAFLDAWQQENYEGMYALLAQTSRDAIPQEDFSQRYNSTALSLSLVELKYELLSTLTNPRSATVAYRVTFATALVGELQRDMEMGLVLENGEWKVEWEDGMIMPELRGGNRLAMDVSTPSRGEIYDREGNVLVAEADAVALGIVPDQIEDGREGQLLDELSRLTGKTPESIQALYEDARGTNWYFPVGETSAEERDFRYDSLSGLGGLVMNDFRSRYYFDGGIAPHVTGYVQPIPLEELEDYQRQGYLGDEKVGRSGLEKWAESYLTGQRGASLYVVDAQGQIVTRLAQVDSRPAKNITTTLESDFQLQVQDAISGFTGAVVVLERDTGRVLAMASSPGFDPNVFEPSNYNRNAMLEELFSNTNQPLINRATQGGYPLGSVFKIITMAAALESGLYTPDTIYECGYEFNELPNLTLYDWTYEKEVAASGTLTLSEGLMRSCNPYFWHIGLDLYRQNQPKLVSELARGFGLGTPTGFEQVAEDIGNMPDPANEGDAVQLAIGQGTMLVTPLQVARFVAAIGNGGTLYRPQVIEQAVSPDGEVALQFKPEAQGELPISDETLKAVQDAMRMVVNAPRGTARRAFSGLEIPVYGKTGTAQNPMGMPHAWFAGYTRNENPDRPDIAIAVIAENAGEGSDIAAPIFRRVVELYFYGKPLRLYDWESKFNVTATPTPLVTETPEAEE